MRRVNLPNMTKTPFVNPGCLGNQKGSAAQPFELGGHPVQISRLCEKKRGVGKLGLRQNIGSSSRLNRLHCNKFIVLKGKIKRHLEEIQSGP